METSQKTGTGYMAREKKTKRTTSETGEGHTGPALGNKSPIWGEVDSKTVDQTDIGAGT